MEFTFLPKVAALRNNSSVRYAIRSFYSDNSLTYTNNGFFYIGKNSANIEKLYRVFKRGYASENLQIAKTELERYLKAGNNTIPEIIFCESGVDFDSLLKFRQFVNSHSYLSEIPFVLDGKNLHESELLLYRKHRLVDEIFPLELNDEKSILAKGLLLKKMKSRDNEVHINRKSKTEGIPFSFGRILKRVFDIVVSSLALLVASPIFLLIAVAIKIESKGPIFYISKRAGKGYKIFNFYKFRTMFVGADEKINEFYHLNQYKAGLSESPVFFKINNDPRITKVGAFLRNSSLDELPQLFNVLLGDMSLVGNRPLPLYEAATLTTDEWAMRFMAPAGITGLWQIKKRGKEEMSAEERISLDIDYANKSNFAYDLWIMANTPSAIFQKTNA